MIVRFSYISYIIKHYWFAPILFVGLSGCASNNVSGLSTWSGKASLIGNNGMMVAGKTIFNVSYGDGELYFDNSQFGNLTGKFITQSDNVSSSSFGVASVFANNRTITVPAMATTSTKRSARMGRAYLSANGKIILLCNMEISFVTTGWGDYEMLGTGVCADAGERQYSLIFERSGAR